MTARVARIRAAARIAAFLAGLISLSLSACSSSSPSSPSDGTVIGRMAWGQASGGNSTIFAADIEFSLSPEKSVNTPALRALASRRPGEKFLGTVVVNGRAVQVSSVVFAPSAQATAAAGGVNLAVTNVRQVSHGTTDYSPAIDADNWDHIFFHRVTGGLAIWLADMATGQERKISNGTDPNASTSNRLLWADNGIRSMNLTTGETRLVLAGANYDPVPLVKGGKHLIFFNSNTRHTGEAFEVKANFVLNEESGVVTKITGSAMKEDNPTPDPSGNFVAWHGWPDGGRQAAVVFYGRFDGQRVAAPIRLSFRDENGNALRGDCWYVTWAGSNMITFMNGEDALYVSDLQGNARSTGLRGSERDYVER
jgi:hypothetical protein